MAADYSRIRSLLTQDIKSVPPGLMNAAFHVNTKLSGIVMALSRGSDAVFAKWFEQATLFVAALPSFEVKDGENLAAVDPFRGAREAFASNRTAQVADIPRIVRDMVEASQGGDGVLRDHMNLLELGEICGFVSTKDVEDFAHEVMGWEKTTAQVNDDFVSQRTPT